MSHQLFEGWLLEAGELDRGQRSLLNQHLAECARCHDLALALSDVDAILRSATAIRPADGFVDRFASRLAQRQAARRRGQTALALGVLAGGSLAALVGLLALWLPDLARATSGLPHELTTLWVQVVVLGQFTLSFLRTADPGSLSLVRMMPLAGLVLVSLSVYAFTSLVWTALYLRLAIRPIRWSRNR